MEGSGVTDLTVHSQHNCLQFSPEQMEALQQIGVSARLEPGTNLVKIRSLGYQAEAHHPPEPLVLLWIYGGRVVNQKTQVPVNATWVSLNGYDDTLVLEVLEPATLCAFFFNADDTHVDGNDAELTLSIVKI